MLLFVSEKLENIMGKGESASNQHLLQFPLGFPKSYFQRRKWRRGLVRDFFFLNLGISLELD